LCVVSFRREILEETSARKGFPGLESRQLASADFAIFDTPLDLVVRLQAHRFTNGLRESHSVLLVNYGRTHREIIPKNASPLQGFLASDHKAR